MMPNTAVSRLLLILDLQETALTDALPENMRVGIQKLYGFQHAESSD